MANVDYIGTNHFRVNGGLDRRDTEEAHAIAGKLHGRILSLETQLAAKAARIAELEAACKLENELKTAGSLRELKLMGEVDELRKQLADLRGDRDTLARELNAYRDPEMCDCEPGVAAICEACEKMNAIIKATNESGALTRAGKDHP